MIKLGGYYEGFERDFNISCHKCRFQDKCWVRVKQYSYKHGVTYFTNEMTKFDKHFKIPFYMFGKNVETKLCRREVHDHLLKKRPIAIREKSKSLLKRIFGL